MDAQLIFKNFKIMYRNTWSKEIRSEDLKSEMNAWSILINDIEPDFIKIVMNNLMKGKYTKFLTFPPTLLEFRGLVNDERVKVFPTPNEAFIQSTGDSEIENPFVRVVANKFGRERLRMGDSTYVYPQFVKKYKEAALWAVENYSSGYIKNSLKGTVLTAPDIPSSDGKPLSPLMKKWRQKKITETGQDPFQLNVKEGKKKWEKFISIWKNKARNMSKI